VKLPARVAPAEQTNIESILHAIEHVLTAIESAQIGRSGAGPAAAIVLLAAARFAADEDTMTV
jgi:hypothetical protein